MYTQGVRRALFKVQKCIRFFLQMSYLLSVVLSRSLIFYICIFLDKGFIINAHCMEIVFTSYKCLDTKWIWYTNNWELCMVSTLYCLKGNLFCLFLIICPFLITSLGSRIPFSEHLLFFTRTKSLTSSLFKAVSYVLVQHYSTDLLLK